MYEDLLAAIQSEIARNVFHVGIVAQPTRRPMQAVRPGVEAPAPQAPARTAADGRLGRNDPCWCGSGKKYKHCHMREDLQAGRVGAQPPKEAVAASTASPKASHKVAQHKKKRKK
ncbi:MAG: SEC-C metal-binding domain-containing protein [Anaerolineae bacterium]